MITGSVVSAPAKSRLFLSTYKTLMCFYSGLHQGTSEIYIMQPLRSMTARFSTKLVLPDLISPYKEPLHLQVLLSWMLTFLSVSAAEGEEEDLYINWAFLPSFEDLNYSFYLSENHCGVRSYPKTLGTRWKPRWLASLLKDNTKPFFRVFIHQL